jgi:hypothetical protein
MPFSLDEAFAFVLGYFVKGIMGMIVAFILRFLWKVFNKLFIRTERDVKLFVRMHHEAMEQHKNKSK